MNRPMNHLVAFFQPAAPVIICRAFAVAALATAVLSLGVVLHTARAQDAPPVEGTAFIEGPCDLPSPPGPPGPPSSASAERLRCGTVAVPTVPGDPGAGVYRLQVVVVKSAQQPARSDALVFLAGGPGGTQIPYALNVAQSPFAVDRDIVLIDARGVGGSEPQLCTGGAWPDPSAFVSTAEMVAAWRANFRACLEEARAMGLAPEGFGTVVAADDVERVRQALGYGPWNAFGISYGTVTGLTLASRHPASLRALVLDSVSLGARGPFTIVESWARARLALLAECAGDPQCASDFPDLEGELDDALQRLGRDPLVGTAATGEDLTVTRGTMEIILFFALYSREGIALVPAMIRDALEGRIERLAEPLASSRSGPSSQSTFAAAITLCRDAPPEAWVSGSSPAQEPFGFEATVLEGVCPDWVGVDPAPVMPDASGVPTLVLAGALDPATPPVNGRIAAAAIGPAARFLLFPSAGHGLYVQSPCAAQIMYGFFADPSAPLDTECLAEDRISFAHPARAGSE